MITLSHAQDSGTKAKRLTISSDAGVIVYTIAIISAVTVASFALLGQHFALNVAKDLRHQSEMLSQAGEATQRARLRRAAEPSISIAA